MSNQQEEDFMGGGDSLKFENVGDSHAGTLLSISSQADTDPAGTVKTWPDGSQKKVFKWALETDAGPATLWVRGNMVKVLREACAKAGAKKQSDLIGAKVQVRHHAIGEPTTKGYQGAKLYQAKVTLAPPDQTQEQAYDPFLDSE